MTRLSLSTRQAYILLASSVLAGVFLLFATSAIKELVIDRPDAEAQVRAACRAAWNACLDTSQYPDCLLRERTEAFVVAPHEDGGLCGLIWSQCWAHGISPASGGPRE